MKGFDLQPGSPRLTTLEVEDMRYPHVTTRAQLNRLEQEGLIAAEERVFTRRSKDLLTEGGLRRLHRRMFGDVWTSAGRFRTADIRPGVAHWDIAVKVKWLCEDVLAWIGTREHPEDGIAARFHHRLVAIRPFAIGNGRHARMAADLVLVHLLRKPRFTWGAADPGGAASARRRYREALRAADAKDYGPLLRFARG